MPSSSPAQARLMACKTELAYEGYVKTGPTQNQYSKLGKACATALANYHASRSRKSYKERKRKHNEDAKARIFELRLEMISAYGGCCLQCGESDPIVLVIDHINDDAQIDRKERCHKGGFGLYAKLKKLGWPRDKYQLLCQNCNFRKEYRRRKNAIS